MECYFDNILFFLQRSGGGSVYWGELMKRFANGPHQSAFIQPQAATSNIIFKNLDLKPTLFEKKLPVKILRYLPSTVHVPDHAIYHSSYYRYSTNRSAINIVTVHDFIYEYFRKGVPRFLHAKQKAAAVHRAKGIVCISESTKNDLLHFYPSVSKKEIRVIYNGVSGDFFKMEDEDLSGFEHYRVMKQYRYLLFIGHRTSYKNFDFAVDLVAGLPESYRLVIVGNPLDNLEQQLLSNKLNDRYLFLGNIPNTVLNKVYNLAFCLVYPSSYEGFGIPIVEAYRSGCPVVAQKVSAIPEVAAGCSLLADSLDTNLFKKNVRALENSNLRAELNESGYQRSLQFSWDRSYNELIEFYEHNK